MADNELFDKDLKLGKAAQEDGQCLTVLELLSGCLVALADSGREQAHRRAVKNELLFHGQSLDGLDDVSYSADYRVSRNYLRNMVKTWSARALEDRPMIKAYPTHAEARDLGTAKVANAFMEYQYQMQSLDKLLWDAAVLVQLHGKTAIKVTWDPSKGKEVWAPAIDDFSKLRVTDDDGNPMMDNLGPEGEISWDHCSVFDYDYGGSDRVDDADWCVFYKYIDRYHAMELVRNAHNKHVEIAEQRYTDPSGQQRTGVKVVEFWYRPGPRLPDGLYALVVDEYLVLAVDYPYDHNQLPLVEWRMDQIRGTSWCTSHVDDAIPLQRHINEKEAAKAETVRKTGVPKGLGLPEIIEAWSSGIHQITVDSVNSVQQGYKYLEPPEPNPLVFGTQGEDVQAMFDIFGLNEVVTGKDSVKSGTSAKQIAYLNRLDSMKLSGAIRDLEQALMRGWRMSLSLARQYVTAERMLSIVGPGAEPDLQMFNGASLDGVDLTLEPQTGAERFRAQTAAEAEQDLQSGKISPQVAMERAETGLGTSMGDASQERMAGQLIMGALNGQQVQPDPNISPAVALRVIYRSMGISPQADQSLQALANAYQQLGAQQNAQAQPQQPQKGGPGSGPPGRPA